MADYTLRDVNPNLWQKVKIRAAEEGKPIRTVLLELLTAYTAPRRFSRDTGRASKAGR